MHPENTTLLKSSDLPALTLDNACSIGLMLRREFFSRGKYINCQSFQTNFREYLLDYYKKNIPNNTENPGNCILAALLYCLSIQPTANEVALVQKKHSLVPFLDQQP